MNQPSKSPISVFTRTIIIVADLAVCAWLFYLAFTAHSRAVPFINPVAYAVNADSLYVAEKKANTLLKLRLTDNPLHLTLENTFRIEEDDESNYYMLRKIYPGPEGLVTRSFIYEKKEGNFVGYRFREYRSFQATPKDILTIYLEKPGQFPDINYAFDKEGNHYFVNNCMGQHHIWKVPSKGNVTIKNGVIPAAVEAFGVRNDQNTSWGAIFINPGAEIFLTSIASERVIQYSPKGQKIREIGTAGFDRGELLAPYGIFSVKIFPGDPKRLTVASTGNRTWVQYDDSGNVSQAVSPLVKGYPFPDISVGPVFQLGDEDRVCSFDLANKALVLHKNHQFEVITTYKGSNLTSTLLYAISGVLLLIPVLFFRSFSSLLTKLRFPFFVKIIILFVPLLIASAFFVSRGVKNIMKTDLEAESVRRSANLAHALINGISISDLQSIQNPEDRSSPAYERIYNTATKIVDLKSVEHTPRWIIHKIVKNRYYYGINMWRGAIFEPFIVPRDRQMFFNVLKEKSPQQGRFVDESGEWLSYLCPIMDSNENVIYVVELYRPTEEIDRAEREVDTRVRMIILVIVLGTLCLILLFSYIFDRPLRKLIQGTAMVSKGQFDHQIEVRSKDEIGTLAKAFNQMVVDLKRYTHDLARTTAAKERIESELKIAHDIQMGILPKKFPPFPDRKEVDIYALLEPAREIGGDLYDFFFLDQDHLCFTVGDVADKGIPASLFMAITKTLIKAKTTKGLTPEIVLRRVNEDLSMDNPSLMFVTLFLGILNTRTGELIYCSGGHDPPYLIRPHGPPERLEPTRSMALGVKSDFPYQSKKLHCQRGDIFFIFSDGVTEAGNPRDELFSKKRLEEALSRMAGFPVEEIIPRMMKEIEAFTEGASQTDDITMMIVKYNGPEEK